MLKKSLILFIYTVMLSLSIFSQEIIIDKIKALDSTKVELFYEQGNKRLYSYGLINDNLVLINEEELILLLDNQHLVIDTLNTGIPMSFKYLDNNQLYQRAQGKYINKRKDLIYIYEIDNNALKYNTIDLPQFVGKERIVDYNYYCSNDILLLFDFKKQSYTLFNNSNQTNLLCRKIDEKWKKVDTGMKKPICLYRNDKGLYLFDLSSNLFFQFDDELKLIKQQNIPAIDCNFFEVIKVSNNNIVLCANNGKSPNILSINLTTNKVTPLFKLPYFGASNFLIQNNYLYFKVVTNKYELYIVKVSASSIE